MRLSAFLRYTVETTLAGEADSLKEFVIGAEVFQRGDSFNPQTDNLVRVAANRLRSKLAEYYHGSGQADAVVIDLPRGRYVPFLFNLTIFGAQCSYTRRRSQSEDVSRPPTGARPHPCGFRLRVRRNGDDAGDFRGRRDGQDDDR